mmetsp:Transcript_44185/g.94739  ORF Transcript_44185/g.94739 Transcript_44185/m.94739 type:complete len:216 (+) Transcript_44185:2488-3135(+)
MTDESSNNEAILHRLRAQRDALEDRQKSQLDELGAILSGLPDTSCFASAGREAASPGPSSSQIAAAPAITAARTESTTAEGPTTSATKSVTTAAAAAPSSTMVHITTPPTQKDASSRPIARRNEAPIAPTATSPATAAAAVAAAAAASPTKSTTTAATTATSTTKTPTLSLPLSAATTSHTLHAAASVPRPARAALREPKCCTEGSEEFGSVSTS